MASAGVGALTAWLADRSSVGRAVAGWVAAAWLGVMPLGCAHGPVQKIGRGLLYDRSLVSRMQLVRKGEVLTLTDLFGSAAMGEEVMEKLPSGAIPGDERLVQVAKGKQYWAAVSEAQPEGSKYDTVWVFRPGWKRIGRAVGVPLRPPPLGDQKAEVMWDPTGRIMGVRLEVIDAREGWAEVGVVAPPNLAFRRLLHSGGGYMEAVWSRGQIVCAYFEKGYYRVAEVRPETGTIQEVLKEPQGDPDPGPPAGLWPSPDGRYMAFVRIPSWPKDFGKQGLWLVDMATGRWHRLTWEEGGDFLHELVGWETDDVLRFRRAVMSPGPLRWDLYRVTLNRRVGTRGNGTQQSPTR